MRQLRSSCEQPSQRGTVSHFTWKLTTEVNRFTWDILGFRNVDGTLYGRTPRFRRAYQDFT